MKLLALALLASSLTSCRSLWDLEYRREGGYFQRPSNPSTEEAAANIKPRIGSSQPTLH